MTDVEIEKLVVAACAGSGELSKERVEAVIEWANEIRTNAALLQNALDGHMFIVVPEEPGGELRFKLSPKGTKHVEALLARTVKP